MPPGHNFAFPTAGHRRGDATNTHDFPEHAEQPDRAVDPTDDLARISKAAPDAVVLIDEAYIEFGGTSFIPYLSQFPNVLLGRTFLGLRSRGPAHRRGDRAIDRCSTPSERHPPVQHQRRRPGRARCGSAGSRLPALHAAQVEESRERLYDACRRLGWSSGPAPLITCS